MSIFPKRTTRNSTVTIHWNFNTAALKNIHIYPFVRIGVRDPDGRITILLEQHLLALPPVIMPVNNTAAPKSLYLNKNTPLLVLADYLGGAQKKEVLAEILQHIEDGKHYYFTYNIPADAPLGRYTLVSELYNGGEIKYSKTAADDFFFVEAIAVTVTGYQDDRGIAMINNQSPEKAPARLIEYTRGRQLIPENITAFELEPFEKKAISFSSPCSFLSYNEERMCIPLWPHSEPAVLRNQQVIQVTKETNGENAVFILMRDTAEGIKLTGPCKQIWEMADGLSPKSMLENIDKNAYADMLSTGLIHELNA